MNSTDTVATPARTRRYWMAVILGSLSAFGPLSLDMYLPALPALADDLNTSASMVQLSLTACLLGLALGQLVAGPVSDVRGRRMPLLIGLLVYAVSSIAFALAPSVWALVILRFIQGVAGAAGIVISRAIVRDMYSGTELTKFFSLLMLINGAAPILAPIFGGQMMRFTSWEGVFIVLGLIGVVMLALVMFGMPETLSPDRRVTGGFQSTMKTFRELAKNRVFMGYALASGLVTAAMFAYISGSPFVLQDIYGVTPQTFSLIFAMNGIGIIIAGQVTGRLSGRVSDSRLLITGLALALLGGMVLLIALLLQAALWAVLVPLFFVVSSVGIVNTTSFSLAMQDQGNAAGTASAMLGVLTFIIGGLVAPLVGIGGSETAIPMGVIIAVAEVGAVLCYLLLARKKA
ncbi:Bcr/CflA family drug resistance efflux transporter [Tumebacillus avium]|uniref:Bcr/CflA family efflux transporter n=1 Tax=Tumebacillus avium TaxID=1903704 RepID=A0A1Y0IV77_9BACL|nr:Bcr/CflA family multidrug efflux MFS transporter [Tumebacillus avium]ARU63696.1 Bcr/CflA family drug resistance efflux transporter [Tumebacillus avium]